MTNVTTPDEIEIDELDWTIVWPFQLHLDQVTELEIWLDSRANQRTDSNRHRPRL